MTVASLAMGLFLLMAHQNCAPTGFNAVDYNSLAGCTDPKCTNLVIDGAHCEFNGMNVRNRHSVNAYLNSNGSCQSEERMCQNGTLAGSYPYAYCDSRLDQPGACIFGNRTIADGQSVTAYLQGTGNCQSQTRTCNDGVLSGSYSFSECFPEGEAPCIFNGQTVAHGSVVRAFQNSAVEHGQSCVSQLRLCTNGSLNGSYNFASCDVDQPRACIFNGQTVPHNGQVSAYRTSTVAFGESCQSQTRTCTDGSLNGSFQFNSCKVGAPANCIFNASVVSHNQSVTAYLKSAVAHGNTCQSQSRTCTNGDLSGSYKFPSCNIGEPGSCEFDGQILSDGQKVRAYKAPDEDNRCAYIQRTCNDGNMSGSSDYTFLECSHSNSGGGSDGDGDMVDGCPAGDIRIDDQCIPPLSQCTNAQKNLWKTKSKTNPRYLVAWFTCEFNGSYGEKHEFDSWVFMAESNGKTNFCSLAATDLLLWDKCKNRASSKNAGVTCHDSGSVIVTNAYEMLLKRTPVDIPPDNYELFWAVRSWERNDGGSKHGRTYLFTRQMCQSNEFKNKYRDFF